MLDHSGPYQAPNPEQGDAEDFEDFKELTFGGRFILSFRLALSQFVFYLAPMAVAGFLSAITFGFLTPAFTVGLSASVLRQIDGDAGRATFGDLFSPFHRFSVMLILALLLWGFLAVYSISMVIASLLTVIPIFGLVIYLCFLVVQIAVNIALPIVIFAVSMYLAEYDDTAGHAVATAFKLIKNNIVRWLGAFLSFFIVSLPLSIVGIGLIFFVLIYPVLAGIIAQGYNYTLPEITGFSLFMLLLGLLLCLVNALFAYVYSLFVYGLTYRQCVAIGENPDNIAPADFNPALA